MDYVKEHLIKEADFPTGMPTVYFVGIRPSLRNKHLDIPFIGTGSWKVLKGWIELMGIENYRLLNISNFPEYGQFTVTEKLAIQRTLINADARVVIALGRDVSEALDSMRIPNFMLPHPSGKNRNINSREYVKEILSKCLHYIKSRS